MPKQKIDPETNKIVEQSKAIKGLMESDAWPILRQKLVTRITDLVDIGNISEHDDANKLALNIKSRKLAADILFTFLKVDIEGEAALANNYDFTLTKESYIVRNEEGQ